MPNDRVLTVKDGANANKTVSSIDALLDVFGEAQASPTANTLLDRLKALATYLATVATAMGGTSTTAATITQGQKVVTAAGTPVRLVATSTLVESVEIFARKSPTQANTGEIYLGVSATPGNNLRVLASGASWPAATPYGKKIDLHDIYVDAGTNGDAVTYTAIN